MKTLLSIRLSKEQKEELERRKRSRILPQKTVLRAKIILALLLFVWVKKRCL